MGHSRPLFFFFSFFLHIIFKICRWLDSNRADLWCRKRPLYQLGHNRCSSLYCLDCVGSFPTLIKRKQSQTLLVVWDRSCFARSRNAKTYMMAAAYAAFSETRFGKISPLFQNFKNVWNFLWIILYLVRFWTHLGTFFYPFGQFFIVENGQILKKTIWSHWLHYSVPVPSPSPSLPRV